MPHHTLKKVVVPSEMVLALGEAPLRAWKEHLRAFQSLHSSSDDVKSPDDLVCGLLLLSIPI